MMEEEASSSSENVAKSVKGNQSQNCHLNDLKHMALLKTAVHNLVSAVIIPPAVLNGVLGLTPPLTTTPVFSSRMLPKLGLANRCQWCRVRDPSRGFTIRSLSTGRRHR